MYLVYPLTIHVVKAMVFSSSHVRMWEFIKNSECWRIDALTVVLEKTLKSSLDCKKIKPVNCKGLNIYWKLEYLLERLMLKLKLQYFGYLMWRAGFLEKALMLGKIEGNRKREQQRMRWLDSLTDSVDMNLSTLWEIVEDRGAWCAVVYGVTKSQMRLSYWKTAKYLKVFIVFLIFLLRDFHHLDMYVEETWLPRWH